MFSEGDLNVSLKPFPLPLGCSIELLEKLALCFWAWRSHMGWSASEWAGCG